MPPPRPVATLRKCRLPLKNAPDASVTRLRLSVQARSRASGAGPALPSPINDPNVLVGTATADDAGVYRLTDEIALVQTVDFFTPIVDGPYDFGRIAAANALSDIYAMGARPVLALNIVAFPKEGPIEVLGEILRGGAEKAAEAGVSIIGGHSIDDREPKYGMAVTGLIHPRKIVTNGGARPGDRLVLTKPLGTGVVATAIKRGEIQDPRPLSKPSNRWRRSTAPHPRQWWRSASQPARILAASVFWGTSRR